MSMDAEDELTITPPMIDAPFHHDLWPGIVAALRQVYDPEIPVNLYELGLIYRVDIDDANNVSIDMSLTAPGCPVAGEMPGMVQRAVQPVEGVNDVHVELVWDPPWTPNMMAETAKMALDIF